MASNYLAYLFAIVLDNKCIVLLVKYWHLFGPFRVKPLLSGPILSGDPLWADSKARPIFVYFSTFTEKKTAFNRHLY